MVVGYEQSREVKIMRLIPATMSTQHPDNVALPPWVKEDTIGGEAEVQEAYYAYSTLGCKEQMWDWEGKDVDPHVVRKLFTLYGEFFRKHVLGRDLFLTYRIPNPSVETLDRKVFIEALQSIPRCHDIAKEFYKARALPPIFEVILPLTSSHLEILRVASTYSRMIIGREKLKIHPEVEHISMEEWLGGFEPKHVEVIPLVEDKDSLTGIDRILEGYVDRKKLSYIRVFLARSDPALNYGLFPAVLLTKVALSRISKLSQKKRLKIFPIIGVGSPPFRGNLTPTNVEKFTEEYQGVNTVTIQSALKYDSTLDHAKATVEKLNRNLAKRARVIADEEEKRLREIIDSLAVQYQRRIEKLSPLISYVAQFVPRRRTRKLHIGLFGYSRAISTVRLPRAIESTSALYSLGIPPELIGFASISDLKEADWKLVTKHYANWETDLRVAAEFLSWENLNYLAGQEEIIQKVTDRFKMRDVVPMIMRDIEILEEVTGIKTGARSLTLRRHENIANNVLISLAEDPAQTSKYILEAAAIRHFLG